MKKALSLFLVIILCLSAFAGCEKPDDEKQNALNVEDIYTEYAGIYLTIESVEDSYVKAVWHNETNKEYTFGEEYYIEILENDEWNSVMIGEMSVASIAWVLPAKATQEKTYPTDCFDLSKEGTYRLRCLFSPGDGKQYNTWVSFEVSEFAGCEKPDEERLIAKHENDCDNIDQQLASEIKIAYSHYTNNINYGGEQKFTPEDIYILRYEGEVGGCHFVMLGGDEIDYTTAFRSVEVAEYVVVFGSGQPMYANKDGNFYTLKQAYDNGYLSESDVYEIGTKVDATFAERYTTPDKTE